MLNGGGDFGDDGECTKEDCGELGIRSVLGDDARLKDEEEIDLANAVDRGEFSVGSEEEFCGEDDAEAFGKDDDADEGKIGEAVTLTVED